MQLVTPILAEDLWKYTPHFLETTDVHNESAHPKQN